MSRIDDLTEKILDLYERNENARPTRGIPSNGMTVIENVLAAMVERGIKTEEAMAIASSIMDQNIYFREIK